MNDCAVDEGEDKESVSDLTITQNFDPTTFPFPVLITSDPLDPDYDPNAVSTSSSNIAGTVFDNPSTILEASAAKIRKQIANTGSVRNWRGSQFLS